MRVEFRVGVGPTGVRCLLSSRFYTRLVLDIELFGNPVQDTSVAQFVVHVASHSLFTCELVEHAMLMLTGNSE